MYGMICYIYYKVRYPFIILENPYFRDDDGRAYLLNITDPLDNVILNYKNIKNTNYNINTMISTNKN